MKPAADTVHPRTIQLGYWAGGLSCVLALFSLALGLSPLLTTFKKNLITARCPGTQTLDLNSPGLYTGVGLSKNIAEPDALKIDSLEYSLVDSDGQLVPAFLKVPRRQYASDQPADHVPLFQFEIERKGKYSLLSNYPYNMEGPQLEVVIIHSDVNYTRAELLVGIVLFFLFGGLGFYLIRKSVKASSKTQKPV